MTNKQSWGDNWEEGIELLFNDPRHFIKEPTQEEVIDFISKLLTSKSEQMEGLKLPEITSVDSPQEEDDMIERDGFNAGISACQEILKK